MSGVAHRPPRHSPLLAPSDRAETHAPRPGVDGRRVGRGRASSRTWTSLLQRHVVRPIADLVDGGPGFTDMASANEDRHPLHPSDSSTMLEDVSGAERDLDEVSTEIAESVEGDADPSASNGAAYAGFDDTPSDAAGSQRRPPRRAPSKRERTVRQIHAKYETSPFVVWFRMIARFLASALATAGLGASAAVYPLYAITPAPILDAMFKGAFNVGYLIYMSFIGRWLHLRMVRSTRASRRAPHSRGIRPTPLSTCSILPVPFLNDNYSYLIVDHATRETAAIDPADPYTIREVTKRLSLRLTAILTTHKHHDHAGGNFELQKACGGSLRVYGHAKDNIPGVTHVVKPGDRIMIGDTEIGVVHVPCHTTGHVVYVVLRRGDGAGAGGDVELGGGANRTTGDDLGSGANALPPHRAEAVFTGDAIINGGVGAFFHGGPRDCYDNLHRRLADVPDDALIFSGHEYMLMNLRFAKWLDEDDETTAAALREVIVRRHHGLSTMPSSFGVERRVNPYFRVANAAFLRKVHHLAAAVEAGKAKRWYRRYLPSAFGKSAKRVDVAAPEPGSERDGIQLAARNGGGDETRFDGVGPPRDADPGSPSVAECVRGIKAVQELVQYRHLLEESGAGGGGENPRRSSAVDESDDEGGARRAKPTAEGPVGARGASRAKPPAPRGD